MLCDDGDAEGGVAGQDEGGCEADDAGAGGQWLGLHFRWVGVCWIIWGVRVGDWDWNWNWTWSSWLVKDCTCSEGGLTRR